MRGDECHRHVKLVPREMKKPMHNARKVSKIKTLGECLLKVKGVNMQSKYCTRVSNDEKINEGLYNKLKV